MDAAKFGAFIAETRREPGMTQARPPFPEAAPFCIQTVIYLYPKHTAPCSAERRVLY